MHSFDPYLLIPAGTGEEAESTIRFFRRHQPQATNFPCSYQKDFLPFRIRNVQGQPSDSKALFLQTICPAINILSVYNAYERMITRNLTSVILFFLQALFCNGHSHAQAPAGVQSYLETIDIRTGKRTVVYSTAGLLESPNWSKDGRYLLYNKQGRLYRYWLSDRITDELPFDSSLPANNDHGFSPDGSQLAISAGDGSSHIYTASAEGGPLRQLTGQSPSYWHGWSPDGKTLAFAGQRNGDFDIYTIPADGGPEKRLTREKGLDDGPDYSPDGQYIYFNSYRTGRMQIWRMKADGSDPEQLTDDRYANWFPHPSPNGNQVVFLSFTEDQQQEHPFGRNVQLRLLDIVSQTVRDLTPVFFGGQGTINVPSWSPDGRRLAFVSYRIP